MRTSTQRNGWHLKTTTGTDLEKLLKQPLPKPYTLEPLQDALGNLCNRDVAYTRKQQSSMQNFQ